MTPGTDTPTISAIAPWYGSNRALAAQVGVQLGRLEWCGVPFCGGCPELLHIKARCGVASDLHRHVINLASVIRDPEKKDRLAAMLAATLFHAEELASAQQRMIDRDLRAMPRGVWRDEPGETQPLGDVQWAFDYFVTAWMGRSAVPGTRGEFSGGLSLRYTTSGGDSAKRFRSAVESLDAWCKALHPWSFAIQGAMAMIPLYKDKAGHGVYVDAPWYGDQGKPYKHTFDQHAALAAKLAEFKHARVVVRYGDHPAIRALYPESKWTWLRQESRGQSGNTVAEVLIVNGPAFKEPA